MHSSGNAGSGCLRVCSATYALILLASISFFSEAVYATVYPTTVAGRTQGSFTVSPGGSATYTIPIWEPPGPQGLQPHIALTYNSASGNGPVGVGWNIAGLSSIYRCNLTYAQDAAAGPVALAMSDGLCLDGQRLRLTGGTYGEDSSTYQTEIANFWNVTAHGTAGNGPEYFTAQDRNGCTYYFGNTTDSRVIPSGSTVLSWQLNEVADPSGNTMTVTYNNATGTTVPAIISWTPSAYQSSTYNYTMTFSYGANVPQSSIYSYVAGAAVTNTQLLNSIAVVYSGTTVRTTYLTYGQSSTTQRDELTSVQECAGSGTGSCLAPTTITYSSGQRGTTTTATTLASNATTQPVAVYDFNGDGRADIAYCNGSTVYVAFGSASGYGTPVSTGLACGALYGDLTGQGRAGILAKNGSTWYYYTWNGSSFSGVSTGLAYDSSATQFLLADTDGDGRPDLIESVFTPNVSVHITIRLNTSTNGTPSFAATASDAYDDSDPDLTSATISNATNNSVGQTLGSLKAFDFNGDGREDIVLQTHLSITGAPGQPPPPNTSVWSTLGLFSTGSGSSSKFTAGSFGLGSYKPSGLAFLNANSDACTDVAVTDGSNDTYIYYSACNGNAATSTELTSVTLIGAMDWDGDGRTDLLVANGSTIGVYLSLGNNLSTLVSTSVPYSSSDLYFAFHANGDGLDDLGAWNPTSHALTYYPRNVTNQPPDLLATVADGFGNSASPSYATLVGAANFTPNSGGTGTYPDASYNGTPDDGPWYAVSSVTYSDPSASGGTYSQSISWYYPFVNVQGRGFDGFTESAILDSRNGLTDTRYYETLFPQTGMMNEEAIASGSSTIQKSVGTPAITDLSTTQWQQRYFQYFSNWTVNKWEFGGTENGDPITTDSTSYTYDNYGNATNITRTVTDTDPGSPYKNDTWTTTTTNTPDESTSPYCLTLLTETQVIYSDSISSGDTVTRTKSFTPDLTHCRYSQIVTEPSSSSFKMTEALGYDNFGNVNSDAVTGVGMTTRTTLANWGTTGQFLNAITDPTNALTQYTYNFSYGKPATLTDPNSSTQTPIVTSWSYDVFGRKQQETRPDGTYTKWIYNLCSGYFGCVISSAINVEYNKYGSNGSNLGYGIDFYDSIDRKVMNLQIMIDGTHYARNELRYDSLGRVSERAFPCTYTSFGTTCSYWTTDTHDVLDRLTQSQRPISSTNNNPQYTNYTYAGRTTTITDALSNPRTIVADVNGRLRQTKDAYGYNVTLSYDAAGSKTGTADSLGNTLGSATYNYGIGAFPATSSDMDMGSWTFTYDALGERTAWTDAKHQSFSATFDALSRPLTRTEPDLFTQWTWGSSAASHNIGRLQSVCTGTGTSPTNCTTDPGYAESETYDNLARRSTRVISIPNQSEAFTYTWTYGSTSGQLSTLTYPASYPSTYSLQLQYAWAQGYLQSITNVSDTPNVTVWQANTMSPANQVTQETLGNGIVTNRSYDAVTGWLGTDQSGVGGGATVKNLSFLYDEMGNVTQREDNNLGLTENAYYDNDYRLTSTKLNGNPNLTVTYDNTMGNITSRSDVAGGAAWTYSTTQKHAVTQAGSSTYNYSYDANGNATARQGNSIYWTSSNYPNEVYAGSGGTAEHMFLFYGPDRSRYEQSYYGNGGNEFTYYIGGLMELVVPSGGATSFRNYIYASNEPVAVYARSSGGNSFDYVLSDHQGSVSDLTSSTGTSIVNESFTPFGQRRNPTTWSGAASTSDLTTAAVITRQGYTFQTQLGLWMGMNHMNGRIQDAITGRMLSADLSTTNPVDSQSYNRYSYVVNNPLTYVDPSGFTYQVKCKKTPYRSRQITQPITRAFVLPRTKAAPTTFNTYNVTSGGVGYTIFQALPGYGFSPVSSTYGNGDRSAAFEAPNLSIVSVPQTSTLNDDNTPNASPAPGTVSAPPTSAILSINNETGQISTQLPSGVDTLGGQPVDVFGNPIQSPVDISNDLQGAPAPQLLDDGSPGGNNASGDNTTGGNTTGGNTGGNTTGGDTSGGDTSGNGDTTVAGDPGSSTPGGDDTGGGGCG